jgi:hypothetical protein
MKRIFQAGIIAAALMAVALPASAHRYDRTSGMHMLRIVAPFGHAVGIGLEYAITRPMHWLISRDNLDIVFGHKAHVSEDGTYFEWTHGDYSPSIAVERANKTKTNQKMVK